MKIRTEIIILGSVTVIGATIYLLRKRSKKMLDELSGYYAAKTRNREVFDKNFAADIAVFKEQLSRLRQIWARLGTVRGLSGASYVSFLPFANLLVRHLIFGFEHFSDFQSFLAWLTFRPGLEALLIIGKIIDEGANAKVWLEREVNPKAYNQAFWGSKLESKALPKSAEFRQVLNHLNDQFMHPNPVFTYRDSTVKTDSAGHLIEVQFFDQNPDLHEAHLLAYLNLMDNIVAASDSLSRRALWTDWDCGSGTDLRGARSEPSGPTGKECDWEEDHAGTRSVEAVIAERYKLATEKLRNHPSRLLHFHAENRILFVEVPEKSAQVFLES